MKVSQGTAPWHQLGSQPYQQWFALTKRCCHQVGALLYRWYPLEQWLPCFQQSNTTRSYLASCKRISLQHTDGQSYHRVRDYCIVCCSPESCTLLHLTDHLRLTNADTCHTTEHAGSSLFSHRYREDVLVVE